jgi:hypothetical protein
MRLNGRKKGIKNDGNGNEIALAPVTYSNFPTYEMTVLLGVVFVIAIAYDFILATGHLTEISTKTQRLKEPTDRNDRIRP